MLLRIYDRLLDAFGVLTALIGAFLAFGISADVILRFLRWGEIAWMFDASEYALFFLTFLGAPWALREGAHVRVDLLISLISARYSRRLEIAADFLGFAASAVLLVWGGKVVIASRTAHSIIDKSFVFAEWWMLTAIPVASVLLCVEFLRRLWRVTHGRVEQTSKVDVF